MDALLAVPDRKTLRGRNEYAILLFLYNTGARVSEATQLRVGDLQVGHRDGNHALATLHGKGGKIRQCPLRPEVERALAELVEGRAAGEAVFLSRLGKPFTRFGIYWLIERCAARVPALAGRNVTPHVLRHTTACHMVLAGLDINTIRAWLGHASISTTNIYAEIDLTMKAKAIALCDMSESGPNPAMEDEQGADGVPELLVTLMFYVAAVRVAPVATQVIRDRRNIFLAATCSSVRCTTKYLPPA